MIACKLEPPPDASTAMRDLIARILLPNGRGGKRFEKTRNGVAERLGDFDSPRVAARAFVELVELLSVLWRRRWRRHGYSQSAKSHRRRHVSPAIPYESRSREIQIVLGCGAVKEKGARFATAAGASKVGMMRTHIARIDPRSAPVSQLGAHSLLYGLVILFREPTARDPRLIGHDDDRNTCVVQPPDSRRRSGDENDLLGLADVFDVVDDGAVAVEERRRSTHGRG